MSMFVTSAPQIPGRFDNLLANASSTDVTPSDTVDLPNDYRGSARGLRVTGAGNVAVNLSNGGTATLTGLSAGQVLLIAVSRVLATGTTATGITSLS